MDAWVYVFSKFTQEALLFEILVLCIIAAAYAAYFVTKKRKYGVIQSEIPSNLVKVYLAQLVSDAEDLRVQLFGLLGKNNLDAELAKRLVGAPAPTQTTTTVVAAPANAAADAELQARLKDLEAKMQEQSKALSSVLNEKTRLEQELALARSQTGAAAESAPASGDSKGLTDRIQQLEAQLAEYAIIEDDLANLKRLQRENKQLRDQVEKAGGNTAPTTSAEATAQASTPSSTTDTPAVTAAASDPVATTTSASTNTPEPTETLAADAPPPPSADPTPNFENLVDQVEKSLEKANTHAEATASTEEPAAAAEAAKPKSETELAAEFEKMLNS